MTGDVTNCCQGMTQTVFVDFRGRQPMVISRQFNESYMVIADVNCSNNKVVKIVHL